MPLSHLAFFPVAASCFVSVSSPIRALQHPVSGNRASVRMRHSQYHTIHGGLCLGQHVVGLLLVISLVLQPLPPLFLNEFCQHVILVDLQDAVDLVV